MKKIPFINRKIIFLIPILVLLFLFLCVSVNAQQLKYGTLAINSNPKGAKVYLDNDYKGETPLELKNISTGQYTLKMTLDGYEDWTSTVIILPVLTVRVTTDLVPKERVVESGSVAVNSNPQGARVYLDNDYKGNTPINLREVRPGRHNIKVTLSGYEEWITNITITPSKVERIYADLKVLEDYGSVSINSSPQGADIYLNEEYRGLTPLNLQNIAADKYTVKVSLPGYEEWIEDITISPGKTARVYAELESRPAYGSIPIYCEQKGAQIFLNGAYVKDIDSNSMVLANIKSGKYEIVILQDGFRAWIKDIEVFKDETTAIDVIMTKI